MTQSAEDISADRQSLSKDAHDLFVIEYWKERGNLELLSPPKTAVPHCWKWADLYPPLMRAAEIVPIEEAERRGLLFSNPGLFPRPFLTSTLYGAYSLYNPGEPATVHRHTVSASRFVLQGEGGFTTVQGEKCMMERGDLIITPAGSWHDHGNDGNEPIIWFDMLDVPLVEALNATIFDFDYTEFDPLSNTDQAVRKKVQTISEPADYSENLYAAPGLVPKFVSHVRGRGGHTPMFVYRWAHTRAALERLKSYQGSPYDGIILHFTDPVTGGAVMPTLSFEVQLLRPGEHTLAHRHTASAVYCVVEGAGATQVDDVRIEWSRNDVFVIPSWHWHEHINLSESGDAVLYSVSDEAALSKLELYREQGRTRAGDIVAVAM